MQVIKLDHDKCVVVEGESAEVVVVSELRANLRQAQDNLRASSEILNAENDKVVSTNGLSGDQLNAVEAFNKSLLIPALTAEVERHTADIERLQTILGIVNG